MAQTVLLDAILRQGQGNIYLELLQQGHKLQALHCFHDGLIQKRRGNQPTMDSIIKHHIQLSVQLHQFSLIRDILPIFRNIVQNNNPESLQAATERLRAAVRQKFQAALQATETQEPFQKPSLFHRALGLYQQSSTDRLQQASQFLWDTYHLCLDTIKINGKMVGLYKNIAVEALQTAEEQKSVQQCQKLCELLRYHLITVIKGNKQGALATVTYFVNLADKESVELLLMIRRVQVEVCMGLELWAEAYNSIQDSFHLIEFISSMRLGNEYHYIESIASVMWAGGYKLIHAYAVYTAGVFKMNNQVNISAESKMQVANKIVLSCLAIDNYCLAPHVKETRLETPNENEFKEKMAKLMLKSHIPSREQLVKVLQNHNIIHQCSSEIREFFSLVNQEVFPKTLIKKCSPMLDLIKNSSKYQKYLPSIQKLLLGRVLGQFSKSYSAVRLGTVLKVVDFIDLKTCYTHIFDLARNSSLYMQIDFKEQVIYFSENPESQYLNFKIAEFQIILKQSYALINKERLKTQKEEQARNYMREINQKIQEEKQRRKELKQEENKLEELRRQNLAAVEEQKKLESKQMKEKEEIEKREKKQNQEIRKDLDKINKERIKLYMDEITGTINRMMKQGYSSKEMSIEGKKLEECTREELLEIGVESIKLLHQKLRKKVENQKQKMIKQNQKYTQYVERAKRDIQNPKLQQEWEFNALRNIQQKKNFLRDKYSKDLKLKHQLYRILHIKQEYVKEKQELAQFEFQQKEQAWRENMKVYYLEHVVKKAKETQQNEKKKQEEQKQRKENAEKKRAQEAKYIQPQKPTGFKRNINNINESIGVPSKPASRFFNSKKEEEKQIIQNPIASQPQAQQQAQGGWRTKTQLHVQDTRPTMSRNTEPKPQMIPQEEGKWRSNKPSQPAPERSGFQRSGPQRSGFQRSGPQRSGFQRSGPQRSGFQRFENTGIQKSGPQGQFQRSERTSGGFGRNLRNQPEEEEKKKSKYINKKKTEQLEDGFIRKN